MTGSAYQQTLALVREYIREDPGPWDIWRPRWDLAAKAPGSRDRNGTLTSVYRQRTLRAANTLVEEGVLVREGERGGARYMTPAVQEQRREEARIATRQAAQAREDWHQVKMRLAGLGYRDISDSILTVRLELDGWRKLITELEDRRDPAPGGGGLSASQFMLLDEDGRRQAIRDHLGA